MATAVAVAAFTAAGLRQLTPLKARCLRRCRTPVAQLLHYGNYHGRLRDLRVGVHHGAYCLGCCWALMVVLVAFGVMNLPAMLILAALITIEKLWRHGAAVGRLTGVILLAFAIHPRFLAPRPRPRPAHVSHVNAPASATRRTMAQHAVNRSMEPAQSACVPESSVRMPAL